MRRVALFPGSFDPFTKGHYDIALRGTQLFDEVIIGIGHNSTKKRYFEVDFMVQKIQELFKGSNQISVISYEGLTAECARKLHAQYLLRGLRNTTDFEYENSIAQVNRHVFNDLETIFIITTPEYAHINSSFVREIHRYGQNVDSFLPYSI